MFIKFPKNTISPKFKFLVGHFAAGGRIPERGPPPKNPPPINYDKMVVALFSQVGGGGGREEKSFPAKSTMTKCAIVFLDPSICF